jgi:hypothetical protein
MGLGAIAIDVCQEDPVGTGLGVGALAADTVSTNPKVIAGALATDIMYGVIQLF